MKTLPLQGFSMEGGAGGSGVTIQTTMAPEKRVTQAQFIEACPVDEDLLEIWLHFSRNDAVQLVDYRLQPAGEIQPGDVLLARPLVLTWAASESAVLVADRPLWLQRVEAGPEQPNHQNKRNLNLYVSRQDVYTAPAEKAPPPRALRAAQRIQYEPGIERLTDLVARDLTARTGQEPGFWVLKHYLGNPLPMLHVLTGTEDLAEQWAELYARLVLGEEIEP